jgi:hypothetical protein
VPFTSVSLLDFPSKDVTPKTLPLMLYFWSFFILSTNWLLQTAWQGEGSWVLNEEQLSEWVVLGG